MEEDTEEMRKKTGMSQDEIDPCWKKVAGRKRTAGKSWVRSWTAKERLRKAE